jgi:ABC-type transport system involved in cytochrome bd biosynthesis fused ATPase/permease subunit
MKSDSAMFHNRYRRTWLLIAAIAIAVAVLVMLVPHAHGVDNGAWIAILPLLFLGIISPLSLLSPLAFEYAGPAPDAPALPASFQRPPPFLRA